MKQESKTRNVSGFEWFGCFLGFPILSNVKCVWHYLAMVFGEFCMVLSAVIHGQCKHN